MAIISPSTFDPLRRYISVRLQQGVPIVDADWNEMEDVRRFELRAFLKWFVGDGVPDGTDAFRIVAIGAANTFTITAGGATDSLGAGRYLVDGLDVFITAPSGFAAQPLHASQTGAAALAATLGVPVIAALPAPPPAGTTRTLTAYLDVWERLVGTAEDPSLVHPGIGTESCARVRREWVVRVREGSAVPASGDPDFLAGHAYSALARITQDNSGVIDSARVVDVRRRSLKLPSRLDFQQIAADAFGAGYAIDGSGQGQLPFSLRDVLNGVLRGGRPAILGPAVFFTPPAGATLPTTAFDSNGDQWAFWFRALGAPGQFAVVVRRQVNRVWQTPADAFQVTGVANVERLAAVGQPGGVMRVFYSVLSGRWQVRTRRFATGAWEAEESVSGSTDNNTLPAAATDATGTAFVAWFRQSTTGAAQLISRQYPPAGPANPEIGAGTTGSLRSLTVFRDAGTGAPQILTVLDTATPWQVNRKGWTGAAWESSFTAFATVTALNFIDFDVVVDPSGAVWLTWATQLPPPAAAGTTVLRARRVLDGSVGDVIDLTTGNPRFPTVDVDGHQNMLVLFQAGSQLQTVTLVSRI